MPLLNWARYVASYGGSKRGKEAKQRIEWHPTHINIRVSHFYVYKLNSYFPIHLQSFLHCTKIYYLINFLRTQLQGKIFSTMATKISMNNGDYLLIIIFLLHTLIYTVSNDRITNRASSTSNDIQVCSSFDAHVTRTCSFGYTWFCCGSLLYASRYCHKSLNIAFRLGYVCTRVNK